MLRLLLDEQISRAVAEGLRRRRKEIPVQSLVEWEGGRFLGTADDLILREAASQNLTLVTYDRKTIPPLIKLWIEAGKDHGGVIFVDERTIRPSDFGGLIGGLQNIFDETLKWNWTNRVLFLRR
jgi:hypothetical protein